MSAMASAVITKLSGLSPVRHDTTDTDSFISAQDSFSVASSSSASPKSFDARSCLSDSAVSSAPRGTSTPFQPAGLRRNEHLAVLLRRDLWKPDSQASRCDTFLCSKRFSIFERRHHCRKCGGIFCSACSTRSTTLIDTTVLPFINPPRNVPVAAYESPEAPVELSRVCDECFDQIHGTCHSRQLLMKARASSSQWEADSSSSVSSTASSPRTPPTPLDGSGVMPMPRRRPALQRAQTLPPPPSVSDELAAYPLCHASAICKAAGGGRWEPKHVVQWVGARPPGFKAQYEIDMEREEAEARRVKANPIIRDGDFQLRAPREFEPRSMGGPIKLSTF